MGADASLAVQAAPNPTALVDNETVTTGAGTVLRQRVRLGGSTGARLAEVTANGSLQVTNDVEQVSGTITQSSGAGASTAAGIASASYPAGSTFVYTPTDDHSTLIIQVSGTWSGTLQTERSVDGQNWYPTNVRRNAAGNQIANQLTANGLYSGAGACNLLYRLRALTGFSGTANIAIAAGGVNAVYLLSEVTSLTEAQYFASSAGGNTAWGVCSQEVNLATAGTEYPLLFLFNNDATGGRVLYLSKTVVGANNQARIRRYRSGPGQSNMTRSAGGTALLIGNRANQAATATAAVAYAGTGGTGTDLSFANKPTQYEKVSYINQSGNQVETAEDGAILIPPQTGILWTGIGANAATLGSVEVAYWDGSSLP